MSQHKSVKIVTLTIAQGLNFLINFITLPYLSRALSYEEYGSYGQVLMIGNLCLILCTLGIQHVITVILVENKNKESVVFSTGMQLILFSSLIGVIILCAGSPALSILFKNDLTNLILLFAPSIIFQIITSLIIPTLIYAEKIRRLALLTIITNILKISVIFVAIQFLHSITYLILFITLASFVGLILHFFSLPKEYRKIVKFDKQISKKILTLSWPMYLTGILGFGIIYMDGFIISTMLSIKDYAIYRNGAIEIPFLASIYSTISIIIMPEITQLNLDKKITQIYELKRRLSLIMACLIYPIVIFMIVMSSEFITIYLSAKYTESAVIFSLYNLILLLRINDYQDILVILKKSKTIFYSNIFSIVINIILNIVFIKFFGLIGAVVAFLMSVTFLAVLLMVRTLKETQNKVKDYFDLKKIAVILLVCLILSLLVYYLNIQFDNVYFLILLSMLYIISVYLILIKLKLFDFTLLQPILTKIPKGDKIYNIVKRFQSYTLKNKTVKY